MNTEISIGFFDLFIFWGVCQGLLLSYFFIKNRSDNNRVNLYQGMLLLFLTLGIFEELLNNTGYIVRILFISDYSEPFNFAFGPLIFLYIRNCIMEKPGKKDWMHFLLSGFWLIYMIFYWLQPDELKYNSYVQTKHPDWDLLKVEMLFSDDPLGIRNYVNHLTGIHMLIYLGLSVHIVLKKATSIKENLFLTTNEGLKQLRNFIYVFIALAAVFYGTKLYFGMNSDIGGYLIASYISLAITSTSYQVLNRSEFFRQNPSFLTIPLMKYQKSSLSEPDKDTIEDLIIEQFEREKYFSNNLASLSDLAKKIKTSSHHVSQVINEKMGKSFFELLAFYRVEEAKRILKEESDPEITIEELAYRVGYNSKSSFNTVFKKLTSQTPSEFRKSNTQP